MAIKNRRNRFKAENIHESSRIALKVCRRIPIEIHFRRPEWNTICVRKCYLTEVLRLCWNIMRVS